MHENDISEAIIGAAIAVHAAFGPGLFESVYELALSHELRKRGLKVERQVSVPVQYDGIELGEGFRLDLLVEGKVVVELKSVETVQAVHKKQLLTQLKLTCFKLGLLINFNEVLLKNGVTRIVNGLAE
jgi:GxxExxY protein